MNYYEMIYLEYAREILYADKFVLVVMMWALDFFFLYTWLCYREYNDVVVTTSTRATIVWRAVIEKG